MACVPAFTHNLTLIGMPASGKSTIARLLSTRLDYGFLDVDHRIEETHGRALNDLVARYGNEGFLDLEMQAVLDLPASLSKTLIAPGGSVIYRDAAMQKLRAISRVVFLDVPLEEIEQRIGSLEARGVVLPEGMTLGDLYRQRVPLCAKYAHDRVDCAGTTPDELAEHVIRLLNQESIDHGDGGMR